MVLSEQAAYEVAGVPAVGSLLPPFPDVQRIVVLRGGGIGDVLFAVPAAWSLRAAYPRARITLLGSHAHRELFARVTGPFDEVEVLPPVPGVSAPVDASVDSSDTESFIGRMRARGFDLAVQLHGGGGYSNPFITRLGATHTVGAGTPDAARLDRTLDYLYYQHEVLRALEVVGLAGAAPVMLAPRVEPDERDLAAARARVEGSRRLVVIHPGASDPRRRWPATGFAEVCAALSADGDEVVLVGDSDDAALAAEILELCVAAGVSGGIHSFAGRLSLGELAGLLAIADVMVANDSGPRHLAQSVGCATVGIYWFGNLINAGPLERGRHRVQLSWTTHCPVCERDCTASGERCEHDVSFVADVRPDDVLADVHSLLTATSPRARDR